MNGKKPRKVKDAIGRMRPTKYKMKVIPSAWELDPEVVLPPDLIPALEEGKKKKEILKWLNMYGEMILEARGYLFLGTLLKWDLTKNNRIRYVISNRYPRPAVLNKISSILYPEDMVDLNAIQTMKEKLKYLAPLLKYFGIVFVEYGSDIEPNDETPITEKQNES